MTYIKVFRVRITILVVGDVKEIHINVYDERYCKPVLSTQYFFYVMKCMNGEIIMLFRNYLILHFRMNGVSTRKNIDP